MKKNIYGVDLENMYESIPEKKPEIMNTIESNYRIARRVYQQLHQDISELFPDFIRSMSSYELQDMNEDIKANGWGVKKITEVQDSQELMKIFQDFYSLTGRLPLSNGLLVVPDGDAPPGENKINMKQLYELFKTTNSHGIVSLPFLGLIQYYLEKIDHSLLRNATTELYSNLSCITLSGARDFQFEAVSDFTAKISFLLKKVTIQNKKMREIENQVIAKKINDGRIFEAKIQDPLGDVIEILDVPDPEHKKTMFSYVEPTLQTADNIDKIQEIVDTNFIDLQTKFDKVNDVATNRLKQKKIEDILMPLLAKIILLIALITFGGKTTFSTKMIEKKQSRHLKYTR